MTSQVMFSEQLGEWAYILPELFLLSATLIILLLGLFTKKNATDLSYYLSQLSLAATIFISTTLWHEAQPSLLNGHFVLDVFGTTLKIIVSLLAMMYFVYARTYTKIHRFDCNEYFVLSLLAILGAMVMISSHSLLSIYLGLELLSLSLYALIAMSKKRLDAIESAFKYFVLGAIASALLLYGFSMLYGISGSLFINEIASLTYTQSLGSREVLVLNFALVFIVIGLAFKFGAVPFHMWVPDVYQGSPTSVTMFLSTIPKIAAFAITARILIEALGGLVSYWQDLLMILALLSIGVGSIVAVMQTNLKRLLAYSTIVHVGFILLGFAMGVVDGYAASLFYLLVYTLLSLAGFGLIIYLNHQGFEADEIEHYQGLAKSQPLLALFMLIIMLTMAGIPPFVGFYSKFFILQQVLNQGYVALAIIVVIFSVVGAFYYLKVIKVMYFGDTDKAQKTAKALDVKLLLVFNILLIIGLSVMPTYLIDFAQNLINF